MKKTTYLIVFLFLLCLPQIIFSQEKKPKIVLVLSGGGAKGIAHIPLLQKLDSLHIVPDLIVGNSMGSIIGGLYAMGYSGDSIEKLTKNIIWRWPVVKICECRRKKRISAVFSWNRC